MSAHEEMRAAAGAQPSVPVMPSACASGGCGSGSAATGADAAKPIRVHRPQRQVPFAAVKVNGVAIAPGAIADEAQQHPAPDPATAWVSAARALAIRELLLQEARRVGIAAEPQADEGGRVELPEEALIRGLLEREAAPAAPNEQECRRYFESRPERFRTPDLFEAAHILIEPAADDETSWAAAEKQARTIAAEVGDARHGFEEAARALSRCPSAAQGGSLGQVRRGELLEPVQRALENLPEGTTGREPVRSRYGWHVLRLERRIEGRALPFEFVRSRIADLLEARSWTVSAARYTALLAARSTIEGVDVNASTLESGLG